jgi:hypothetical protein
MDLPISLLTALSDDLIRIMCEDLPRLTDVQALCERAGKLELAEAITESRVWSGRWGVVSTFSNGDPHYVNPRDIEAPQGIVAAVQPLCRGCKPLRLFEDSCELCGYRTAHDEAMCHICHSDRQPYSAESDVDQTDWMQPDFDEYNEHLLKLHGFLDWTGADVPFLM